MKHCIICVTPQKFNVRISGPAPYDCKLFQAAVKHVDDAILRSPETPGDDELVKSTVAYLSKKGETLCPEQILEVVLEVHGSNAPFSSVLRDHFESRTRGETSDQKPSPALLECASRVWNWLKGAGKHELRKARTLKGAFNSVEPLCRVRSDISVDQLDGIARQLRDLLANYRRRESAKVSNPAESPTSLLVKVWNRNYLQLFRSDRQLCRGMGDFLSCCDEVSGGQAIRVSALENELSISQGGQAPRIQRKTSLGPFGRFAAGAHDEDGDGSMNEVFAAAVQPLGFAGVRVPVSQVGRVIGKRGANIKALKLKVQASVVAYMHQHVSLAENKHLFNLSLSVASESQKVGAPKLLLAGVWPARTWLLEEAVSGNSVSAKVALERLKELTAAARVELSRLLEETLQGAVSVAKARSTARGFERTCRLPHLCELKAFQHAADKERARAGRFAAAKHWARQLRSRGIVAAPPSSVLKEFNNVPPAEVVKSLGNQGGRALRNHWARAAMDCSSDEDASVACVCARKVRGKEQHRALKASKRTVRETRFAKLPSTKNGAKSGTRGKRALMMHN
jgi:hypothetical protein